MVLDGEPVTMALVASDWIATKAGRFEPAVRNYPMNDSNKRSPLPA